MSDILQRARDIAADQYIRLAMKNPVDFETFADWSAHIVSYANYMRSGQYDSSHQVQTALVALRSVEA